MTDDEKMTQLDFADPRQALEHAKAALAGDNEGVRLWMLDCGELVAKHRDAALAATERFARLVQAAIEWDDLIEAAAPMSYVMDAAELEQRERDAESRLREAVAELRAAQVSDEGGQ